MIEPGLVADRSEPALPALWRRDNFRWLLVGQTASGLGDWMATVALMALVLDLSGSSTAVGGVLVLRLAPSVVAGPLAGRLVTRWDRKRTMLTMDLMRAGIVAVIPFVSALWWVYLWAFVLEVGGLIFLPARDASVPDVTGGRHLPLANGLMLGSSYGTIPLGAGAFAAVAALAGGHSQATTFIVFWVDAATFLVSFLFISRLSSLGRSREPAGGAGELGDGGRFVDALRLPLVRAVAPSATVISLGLGALFSLGIVFVREVLGASNVEFAVLIALFGVGGGAGLGALQLSGRQDLRTLRWTVGAQGLVVAAMSQAPQIGWAFLGAVMFGAATAATLAGAMSILQERLADERRVMAFTAFHIVIRAGLAVSALSAGVAADLVTGVRLPLLGQEAPARIVLLASGLLVLLTAALSRGLNDDRQYATG